jgi:hypothetical protein
MIHAPLGSGDWEPLTALERARGAKLVRALAERMKTEM